MNRADNQQEIYENGVLVAGPGSNGSQATLSTNNVVFGTSRNNGSFVGAVDEIKVFGDMVLTPAQIQAESINGLPVYVLAVVASARLDQTGYHFTIVDDPASVVNTASITVNIDGAGPVAPTSVSKTAGVTTVFYAATGLASASNHTYAIAAKDQSNQDILGSGSLNAPYFPATLLPGPAGSPGVWGMREHRPGMGWDTGLSVAIAAAAALPETDPDTGDIAIIDGTAPVVNHTDPQNAGTGGNFNNDLPYIGNQPGDDDNVMVIAKTQVVIAAAGPVTYSIHSDDGMGLRISGGPVEGADSKFVSINGGGNIDPTDSKAVVFPGFTGDSNTRAVYNFTAPGTYDVQFVAFEGGGGASWELASAPGSHKFERDTNAWTLVGNPNDPSVLAVPYKPRWITSVPGPSGAAGRFGVRTYFSAATVGSLQDVSNFLTSTVRTPEDGDNLTFDNLRDSINGRDNGSTGTDSGTVGGDYLINGNASSPQGDNNRAVTTAKGRISVPADSHYTFWARGDDGFLLRIKAASGANPGFKRATNAEENQANGRFEMSNPNELFFDAGTGDSNTRGIIFLTAGEYDLEYIHWEGEGGFWYELTAAAGEYPHGTEPPEGWRVVGYDTPSTSILVPGIASPGWTVESSTPGRPEFAFSIAGAEAAIDATLADGTAPAAKTSTWPIINFADPQNGSNGYLTPNNPWPLNTTADDDNYAMRATGTLDITVAGEYYLGFQGDDGGYMEITGPGNPAFSSIFVTNHPAQAVLMEAVAGSGINNRLQVEVGTGNSRTLGAITLGVGSYTVKTLMYEGSGGSWWEVIGAKAPTLPSFAVPLLAAGSGSTATDRDMLVLVAPPEEPLRVTNLTFDSTTGDFSLSFSSVANARYRLEYSTHMEAGTPGTPEKWNVAPLGGPIQGLAGTTTLSGNIAAIQAAGGGVLPDGAPRAYVRVRRL